MHSYVRHPSLNLPSTTTLPLSILRRQDKLATPLRWGTAPPRVGRDKETAKRFPFGRLPCWLERNAKNPTSVGGRVQDLTFWAFSRLSWRSPKVTRLTLEIPSLPWQWQGKKLVQISDLHCNPYDAEGYWDNTAQKIIGLAPDVVMFTGDMVNFGEESLRTAKTFLEKLSDAVPVCLAVLGNHDQQIILEGENAPQLSKDSAAQALTSVKFHVLRDQMVGLRWDAESKLEVIHSFADTNTPLPAGVLYLAGTEDTTYSHSSEEKPKNLFQLLQQCPWNQPLIVLSHNPNIAKILQNDALEWFADRTLPKEKLPAAVFTGHTHGGQVNPFIPMLEEKVMTEKAINLYGTKLYPMDPYTSIPLYTTSGVGKGFSFSMGGVRFDMPAFRLMSRPEIVEITLKASTYGKGSSVLKKTR